MSKAAKMHRFLRQIPKASDRKLFADAAFSLMPGSFGCSKPMHHR